MLDQTLCVLKLYYLSLSLSSPVAQCVARRAPMQQCVWWLVRTRARHSVRMTYRPSAVLRLLRNLRISDNKFLRANK